jgi:predicted nuclease of predicted toxin-antitoxin system
VRRFLLDANLSPNTTAFLTSTFEFDAIDLMSLGLGHLEDTEVVEMAKREGRIVITEDLDFGKLYFHYERARVGIIVLRMRVQSAESVNRALGRFFDDPSTAAIPLERSLVVIDDARARVMSEP